MKQNKQSFVWPSPGEKKMGPNRLFLIWCIWSWLMWVLVKILISLLFFSAKLKFQILLQGISDATNIVIYHAVTTEKSEKKSSLIQYHNLPYNKIDLDLSRLLKETRFNEKKKEVIKTWTLHKRKVHIKKKEGVFFSD